MFEILTVGGGYFDDGDPAKGDRTLGYYGEIPAEDFITGEELAKAFDIPISNALDLQTPWLKFSKDDKTLYIAKHPIINFISWATLNSKGVVTGKNILVQGRLFTCRLIKGSNDSDSEWNSLIYRVSENDPTGTFWESFTNKDLVVGVGDGRTTWCQEQAVYRGYASLTDYRIGKTSSETKTTGWRPILEAL